MSARVPRRAAPDETGTSFRAEQFTPPPKSLLQGRGGLGRIEKSFSDLPLVFNGEPNNLGGFDGPAGGFTRRRHDKIGEGAPFDFGGTLQQRVNVVRQTRFKSGGGLYFLCHDNDYYTAKCRIWARSPRTPPMLPHVAIAPTGPRRPGYLPPRRFRGASVRGDRQHGVQRHSPLTHRRHATM